MKQSCPFVKCFCTRSWGTLITWLFAGVFFCAGGESALGRDGLSYRFVADSTNAYKLECEVETDGRMELKEGVLWAITTQCDTQKATVSLEIKWLSPAAPQMGGPYSGVWNPFLLFSPRHSPKPSYQVEIDAQGRVLRIMGEGELPPPFNELHRFLFPALPDTKVKRWDFNSTQTLPCDSWGVRKSNPYFGMGYNPRDQAVAEMPARRAESFRVRSQADGMTLVDQKLSLESWARTGAAARWSIQCDTQYELSRPSGWVHAFTAECVAIWSSGNTVRRAPIKLRCAELSPEALGACLARLNPKPRPALTDDAVIKLLQELDSSDHEIKQRGLESLSESNVGSLKPDTMTQIESALDRADNQTRSLLLRFLVANAGPAQKKRLLSCLKTPNMELHSLALSAIGRLKIEEAAPLLANLIAQGNADFGAVETLKQIGPPAEKAMLGLLKEKNFETLRRACEVLSEVGTHSSVEPLQALLVLDDEGLVSQVRQAIQNIKTRAILRAE